MGNHIFTLMWVILFSGILGGVINFFIGLESKEGSKESWFYLVKSILLGVGASILVPLFLETISSNLLEPSISTIFPEKNYFVVAGFCLLASIFSRRFIEDLYTRVVKAEKTAREAKEAVEEVEASRTEIDDADEIVFRDLRNLTDAESEDRIKKVIRAALNSKYTYRTVSGISRDASLDRDRVSEILKTLEDTGLARNKKDRAGNDVWKITMK